MDQAKTENFILNFLSVRNHSSSWIFQHKIFGNYLIGQHSSYRPLLKIYRLTSEYEQLSKLQIYRQKWKINWQNWISSIFFQKTQFLCELQTRSKWPKGRENLADPDTRLCFICCANHIIHTSEHLLPLDAKILSKYLSKAASYNFSTRIKII